jgi:hypothetical protein
MPLECREDAVKLILDVNWRDYELVYPSEFNKLVKRLNEEWARKIVEFHNNYISKSKFDTPLGYIVFYEVPDVKVVKIIAISLYFSLIGPEIDFIDIDEWLQSRNDP